MTVLFRETHLEIPMLSIFLSDSFRSSKCTFVLSIAITTFKTFIIIDEIPGNLSKTTLKAAA